MEKVIKLINDPVTLRWIYLLLGLFVIYIAIRIINKTLSKYIASNSTRYSARKFLIFFGYLAFAIFAMTIFNYNLSNISLALGVAGAGIAFALQEVIVSVAGFLAILFGNFYKVGDRVQLGGIKGDVVDVGVLRTTLMEIGGWVGGDLYNGKMVRVSNSFIFKEPVYNYSGEFPFLWDEMIIPLKHSSDIKYSTEVFSKILNEELGAYVQESKESWKKLKDDLYIENAQIEPMISLVWDENWISFTLRYIVDFKKRRGTKNILYTKIMEAINKSEGKMKIASAAMEITQL